jgi:tetratricopeptide (TPR) repeat protein
MLRAVISRYYSILTVYNRDETAQDWARTKNNLGAALMSLAIALDDSAAIPVLREAIAAYEDALTVRPALADSRGHINVRNNLGVVYRHLGARLDGVDGIEALRTSIAALETVVASRSPNSEPLDWAEGCSNLAMSEAALADRLGDAALMDRARDRLNAAIFLFEQEGNTRAANEARDFLVALA